MIAHGSSATKVRPTPHVPPHSTVQGGGAPTPLLLCREGGRRLPFYGVGRGAPTPLLRAERGGGYREGRGRRRRPARAGARTSPARARRSPMVRSVQRSARSPGSSSSAQVTGAETGAPRRGRTL